MGYMFGFLRAINVGGRRIAMVELAAALTDMGLAKVETFIASGNVVFDDAGPSESDLQDAIENGLAARFGFKSEIFLRTGQELTEIAAQISTTKSDTDVALNVGFFRQADKDQMTAALAPWQSESDRFDVYDSHFNWFSKTKISDTPFFNKGYTSKAMPIMTVRTSTTIERMLAKWGGQN